jgi:hypothetical protein
LDINPYIHELTHPSQFDLEDGSSVYRRNVGNTAKKEPIARAEYPTSTMKHC